MRFLLALILFSTANAWALTQAFRLMPRDRVFMSFALERYLRWHDSHFTSLWEELQVSAAERRAVDTYLHQLDHWLVPGHPQDYQFKVGYLADQKGRIHQSVRLYLAGALPTDHFLVQQNLPKSFTPRFYELGPAQRRCWLGVVGVEKSPWELTRWCRETAGQAWKEDGVEVAVDRRAAGFTVPFPSLWQVHTLKRGEVVQVRYFSDATHPSAFPSGLYKLINLHITEGMLPANDFSQTRDGKKTIYFP